MPGFQRIGLVLAFASPLLTPAAAVGEIVSVAGSVNATIRALDASGVSEEKTDGSALPDSNQGFPLQAVARLVAAERAAAGAVAAQLADPRTSSGLSPEEFAFSLTLNSLSSTVYYSAEATANEVRQVRLLFGDVGLLPPGARVTLRGRLYLDGALALFAVPAARDLSGAELKLHVSITQRLEDEQPQTVLEGELHIAGGPDQTVTVTTSGDFPTRGVFDADLAALDEELGVLRVLSFPDLMLEYPYAAVIGGMVELRARLEVRAANLPGGVGVAAILGTPLDTLPEIIALTRDERAAKQMATAIERQRTDPGGDSLESPDRIHPTGMPLCGALGIEGLLGLCVLVGNCRWRIGQAALARRGVAQIGRYHESRCTGS